MATIVINDGGELARQAMLMHTADAEEALENGGAVADPAPKEWTVERACIIFDASVNEQFNRGAITEEDKLAWTALAKTLPSHYDVFSFQAAMLWRVLEMSCAKAKRNHDRLLKIPTYGFMDKNNGWISCVLRVASEHLLLPHSSVFPGNDDFVPQSTTEAGRTTLRRLISQLMEVALIATCNGCGEWVAFDKKGDPFINCKSCRDANQRASELRLLNGQLEEKKLLLLPLEELLTELSAAGSYWVADMVTTKGRKKAHVAFDNAFKHQTEWLTKQVADLWITIKTNGITEADRQKVEKMTGYIRTEIENVRTFQHLTWCSCGAPTYDWMHPKKLILMKAGDKCEECRRADRRDKSVVADHGSSLSDDDVSAAQHAGVGVTSADGKVLVEPEAVEPVFDPSGRFTAAWQRKVQGKEREKKGKKGKKK